MAKITFVEVVVEYSYEAEQPDELSIKPGDMIKNVIMVEGGWWEGELNGKKGMFPDNFVKVIKNAADTVEKRDDGKKKQVQASKRQSVRDLANKLKDSVHEGPPMMRKRDAGIKKKRAKVIFSYDPENDDELQLTVGDVVEVLKQEEEGWWEGILNGKQGVFPSNFVEVVEESENTEAGAGDKAGSAAPGGGEDNMIKGKKIQGVGLGNIFGDGPIKLRSTAGKAKVGDKPQEPPKTEKRSEESVMRRQQKDARSSPYKPHVHNPSPVKDPTPRSRFRVVRCDEQFEMTDRDDRHNVNNSSNMTNAEKHHADFYIESNGDLEVRTVENPDYNDQSVTSGLKNGVDDHSEDMASISKAVQDNKHVNLETGQAYLNDGSTIVNKSAYKEKEVKSDGDILPEDLQYILDDLDICLNQSCREAESHTTEPVEVGHDSVRSDDDCDIACFLKGATNSTDLPAKVFPGESTPIQSLSFTKAIDSVAVTKKRYDCTSRFNVDSTPRRGREEPATTVEVPTQLYLSKATKHQEATYLSALNSSGHLSPFLKSIANKYNLFDRSQPHFKEIDVDEIVDTDEADTSYGSFMMEHTPDVQMPQAREMGHDQTIAVEKQTQVNDMVRNYVYDVLTDNTKERGSAGSSEVGLAESDLDIFWKEPRPDEDTSMMVCVDESSVRLLDVGSKENLVAEQEKREEDSDSLSSESMSSEGMSSEVGVLLCMTEGSDSSPPLSCCSDSLYPRFNQVSTPCSDLADQQVKNEKFRPKLKLERPFRSLHNSPESFSGLMRDSYQDGPKLPDSGERRATSSYCRIPFQDDVPAFWFKKDFQQTPPKNVVKIRSPKRSISAITDAFPSLFALAEKVYLEEFQLKINMFKAENLDQLLKDSPPYFFCSRSPSRKRRKRVQDRDNTQHLSPKQNLNFNSNALTDLEVESILYPEISGSVDAYFAEKIIEAPSEIVQQVIPSPAHTDLCTANCYTVSTPRRIDWSESLFNRRVEKRRKSRNTKHVHIHEQEPQTVGDIDQDYKLETRNARKVRTNQELAQALEVSNNDSTDDSLDNLINECTEKRKKRRFTPRYKSDSSVNPVQLISYHKLDADSIQHSTNSFKDCKDSNESEVCIPSNSSKDCKYSKARSLSSFKSGKTMSVVDLILKQDPSIYVSQKQSETFPRHKIQDIVYEMANEDTNNALSYFHHGDEQEPSATVQPKMDSEVEISAVDQDIDDTLSSLQQAVEEHEMAIRKSDDLSQTIRMLDTRSKMYEAISEAVSFCADEIDKEQVANLSDDQIERKSEEMTESTKLADDQIERESKEMTESTTKPDKSQDMTPDLDALEKDLNDIDLSGTPKYANEEVEDKEMKTFLSEAMESFDNILNESFSSSADFTESDQTSDSSEYNPMDDTGDSAVSDAYEVDGVELEGDSVLVVQGKSCTIHEPEDGSEESKSEGVLCPDQVDTTVEVEDDSILNVVGHKCHFHNPDDIPVRQVASLKDLHCAVVDQLVKESATTVRLRDESHSYYDEAYEVEDKTDNAEKKSPDFLEKEDGKPANVKPMNSPIPGYFCTQSTLEHGFDIGAPDYESSPLMKIASRKKSTECQHTGEVDAKEILLEEDPIKALVLKTSEVGLKVHKTSPVELADVWKTGSRAVKRDSEVITDLTGIKEEEEEELDVSDDTGWMEEHLSASRSRTPAHEAEDLLMTACPTEFDAKLSSYPSP